MLTQVSRCCLTRHLVYSHCSVPGDRMSSSMSSRSSERRRCWGVGGLRPRKDGSRLRAAASAPRPGLLTRQKPVRHSICCQRWSFSRSAAVTSARACLRGGVNRRNLGQLRTLPNWPSAPHRVKVFVFECQNEGICQINVLQWNLWDVTDILE